ncbi:hypothetical protein [Treponema sp. R80B11-R83G3]
MNIEEKKFFDVFEKLEPSHQAEVVAHANLILHIQESTKKRMIEFLTNSGPQYADRNPAPMGALKEAVNG